MQMNYENMLSETGQTQKAIQYMIPSIWDAQSQANL